MKKKTRDIVVRGCAYAYGVVAVGVWPGVLEVRVWAADGERLTCALDPFVIVEPSGVRALIEWALDAGWKAEKDAVSLTLNWAIDCPVSRLAPRQALAVKP